MKVVILAGGLGTRLSEYTKNIPNIKITDANHFSSYDLVKFEKLILTISAIKDLEKRLI